MIDWQLQFTFDNFLSFCIYRLDYSNLFMSTTVCSSACRRYEPLIAAVALPYFLAFSYYIYWLIFSCRHLHILVSFYPSLLCLYAFCIFPLQVLQQFILPLHAHLLVIFSEVLQQHFRHFLTVVFKDVLLHIFCFSVVPILFFIHKYHTHMVYIYFWYLYNMYIHRYFILFINLLQQFLDGMKYSFIH